MIWQDIVISLVQWTAIIALLPSVRGVDKPALSTSIMTGTLLLILGMTFATLFLFSSAISSFLVGGVWFILAIQKYRMDKKVHPHT